MKQNKVTTHLTEILDRDIDAKNVNLWPAIQEKVGLPNTFGRRVPRQAWAAALALIVLIGGLFWLGQPTHVSAHEVIERAAAVTLGANQIIHRTYRIGPSNPNNSSQASSELWMRTDGNGAVAQTAYTYYGREADGTVSEIDFTLTDWKADHFQDYSYDVKTNVAWTRSGINHLMMGGLPNFDDGASVANYFKEAAADDEDAVTLLPDQMFHGVPAVGLRVNGGVKGIMTAYFAARTYKLLGIDTNGTVMWLESEEVVPEANVPDDAFTFSVPAGAEVHETVYPDPEQK